MSESPIKLINGLRGVITPSPFQRQVDLSRRLGLDIKKDEIKNVKKDAFNASLQIGIVNYKILM